MVRATVAFAVVALGAAAVIAQAPEGTSQLEARDFNNDLELREYAVDDLEARGDYEEFVDVDARDPDPQVFDDIEAREYEADELVAREFDEEELEARAQAPLPNHPPAKAANSSPSQTVTITNAPSPTPCTKKEVKAQKEQKEVKKAIALLRSVKGKKDLSAKEKTQVKKARKFLRKVKRRRTKAAKRTFKKCNTALRKAGLTIKDCKAGANCASALTGKDISPAKCEAAAVYLQRLKAAKKAKKNAKGDKKSKKNVDASKESKKSKKSTKSDKSAKKSSKTLSASKTTSSVGPDGITTVTVNAPGPTCTATSSGSKSKLSKKLVARDIVDEEFESVFAREYDVDELD